MILLSHAGEYYRASTRFFTALSHEVVSIDVHKRLNAVKPTSRHTAAEATTGVTGYTVSGSRLSVESVLAPLLLFLIMVTGLYLRVLSIQVVPFYEDEYASALQVKGILETLKPTLPSGWVQWAEPVAYPYFVSLVWRLIDPGIAAGRLVSANLGILSILLAYSIGKRLKHRELGLVFALLVATNIWEITTSTYFRSYASADLAFLIMCYLAVRWLENRRPFTSYLLLLAATSIIAVAGHYLLALAVPAIALMPLLARLSDAIGSWAALMSRGTEGRAQRMRQWVRLNRSLVILTLFLGLVLGLVASASVQYGAFIAKGIGGLSKEFFTVLPDNIGITFRPFFAESLWASYGWWLLLVLLGGAVMLVQAGRRGAAIILMFTIPFIVLSTVFASLTVTSMFDRYLFPFNPALLLMVAFAVTAAGDRLAWLLMRFPFSALRQRVSLPSLLVPMALAFGLAAESPAFVVRFDQTRTVALIEAWIRARDERETPSYHRAAMYLKDHLGPDDVVLGTRTVDLAFELPHAKGYWLVGNPKELLLAGIRTDHVTINRYTGYPAITNLAQLLDATDRANVVWLMLPYFHDNSDSLTQSVWRFVHSQTRVLPAASDNTLQVFQWKPRTFRITPLTLVPQVYGNAFDVLLLDDYVVQLSSRPGSADWSGLHYRLPKLLSASGMAFIVSIKLDQTSTDVKNVKFDLILEEDDGDRWHVPSLMTVPVGGGWQMFFLPSSDLQFWPLGRNTKEQDRITSIRVEAHRARDLAFVATVTVHLMERSERKKPGV